MKKAVSILLALVMALSFAGCKKNGDGEGADGRVINGAERHFTAETTAKGIAADTILSFTRAGDELKLIVNYSDRTSFESVIKAVTLDSDGGLKSETTLEVDSERVHFACGAAAAQDGTTWLLFLNYHIGENAAKVDSVTLEAFDENGTFLKSITLNDIPAQEELSPHAVSMIAGGDGYFYVCFEGTAMVGFSGVFDESGALVFDFTESDGRKTKSAAKTAGGNIAAFQIVTGNSIEEAGNVSDLSPVMKILDVDGKKLIDETPVADYAASNQLNVFFSDGGGDFDLLRCEKTAIYGMDMQTGDLTLLAGFAANFLYQGIQRFAVLSGGHIIALEYEKSEDIRVQSAGCVNVVKYTESDEPENNTKTKLILGALFTTPEIDRTIADFNRLNPDYEIEVKLYSGEDGYTAYNLALITGDVPDITVFKASAELPLKSYFNKGVFTDLYEFIDADPDISREDFIPSVLNVLETDGKLYGVSEAFHVGTLIGKTSDVGAEMGWTWEEYGAFLRSKPETAIPIGDCTRESYVTRMVVNSIDSFINEDGTCNFNSPEFYGLLEEAKRHPSASDGMLEGESDNPADYRTGDRLLCQGYLGRFDYLNSTVYESAYFGEEITYKGFPTKDGGSGAHFHFINRYAVSAKSERKEGAWAYIKYLLTDYQYIEGMSGGTLYGFPVMREPLQLKAEKALSFRKLYGDDYIPQGYVDGLGMVDYKIPEPEDVQKIFDLIDATTVEWRDDYGGVTTMIYDEIPYYFSGQKTAEQVAAIIQDRASIYLSEIS